MSYNGYIIKESTPIILILFVYIVIRIILIIRSREIAWRRECIRLLFVIYIAKLIGVTLFPLEIAIGNKLSIFPISYEHRFVPVIFNINPLNLHGLLHGSIALIIRNIGGNLVMMTPYTILLAFNFKFMRRWINAIGAALITSIAIELLQLVWQYTMLGLGRRSSIDDVIANVIGAAVGYALYHYLFRTIPSFKTFIVANDDSLQTDETHEMQVV